MASMPFREGRRYRFRNQEFRAVNGRIWIEDQTNGNFKSLSAPEFTARAISFNEGLKLKWHCFYEDERTEMSRCVCAMVECINDARNQGDPSDMNTMSQVARENRPIQALITNGGPVRLPKILPNRKYFGVLNDRNWVDQPPTSHTYLANGKPRLAVAPPVDNDLMLHSKEFQAFRL